MPEDVFFFRLRSEPTLSETRYSTQWFCWFYFLRCVIILFKFEYVKNNPRLNWIFTWYSYGFVWLLFCFSSRFVSSWCFLLLYALLVYMISCGIYSYVQLLTKLQFLASYHQYLPISCDVYIVLPFSSCVFFFGFYF